MQLSCPSCGATYQVPDDAIGPNGRKIRCRACDASWTEAPRTALAPPIQAVPQQTVPIPAATPVVVDPQHQDVRGPDRPAWRNGPWLLLASVVLVVLLGVVAAALAWGPQQLASRIGIGDRSVPLGIAITREPDWRMIAGGSQLFAVSGRIWNPTRAEQPVPDIRAELKDAQGRTVYHWTITRPVPRLAPGASANFDGAAVDVPASSSKVNVTFAGNDDVP